MNQVGTGICFTSNRIAANLRGSNAVYTVQWWKCRLKSAALFFCVALGFLPHSVFAQQSLVIDVNVFGVNTNQETASQQLNSACDAVQNETSAAALDLLNTCQLISELDQNNPDDVLRLQEILDTFAPEEAFSVNDSIVYVSDYQTTNVYARINSLRSMPTSGDTNNDAESIGWSGTSTDWYLTDNEISPVFTPSGGGAAVGDLLSRLGVFFTGQVSSGDVNGSTFEQDSDINSSSFTLGADYRFTNNVIAGVGFGVLQNKTEFASVDGGTDSEGFNLTAFGSWYEEGEGYIDLVLDSGSNSHDLERGIGNDPNAPVLAQSSTDSSALSLSVSAGRYFTLSNWDLGGYLRLSLTSGTIDGYTERASNTNVGSGSVFSFDSQSVKSTKMVVGVEASRVFNTGVAVLIPVVRIEYESENDKKKDDLEVTLVTSQVSAAYRGTDRDTSYTNLGLGGSAVFKNGKSAYAFYETHLMHDFVTQNWMKFGLRLEF